MCAHSFTCTRTHPHADSLVEEVDIPLRGEETAGAERRLHSSAGGGGQRVKRLREPVLLAEVIPMLYNLEFQIPTGLQRRTHTHTHTHICTHTYAHTHIRTHTYTHTDTHKRAHAHTYTRADPDTRPHTHANTHTHTHMRTHPHTHTSAQAAAWVHPYMHPQMQPYISSGDRAHRSAQAVGGGASPRRLTSHARTHAIEHLHSWNRMRTES
eukprot:GHVU01226591.1.p1 GENE.GHVU01226591.1~~GHVU01226591.1.p1  ORF type:complete len:211 (-),score=9.82 GHVU01226591.1:384-1016(-)